MNLTLDLDQQIFEALKERATKEKRSVEAMVKDWVQACLEKGPPVDQVFVEDFDP